MAGWVYGFVCGGGGYIQEHPKAQPAVVLIFKHIRRRGHSFISHLTDWEKLGIKSATHGIEGIDLSPTPRRLHNQRSD